MTTSDSQLDVIELILTKHALTSGLGAREAIDELISRGVLIPRDEALAAQGALIEQAAQTICPLCIAGIPLVDGQWNHDRVVAARKFGHRESDVKVECLGGHIRSLATVPMQAALERQQASVAAFKELAVRAVRPRHLPPLGAITDPARFGTGFEEACVRAEEAIRALPVNEVALEKVKAAVWADVTEQVVHTLVDYTKMNCLSLQLGMELEMVIRALKPKEAE